MELGGLAPFIIFKSADIKAAVSGLLAGKYRNMGQVCIAPNRVFIHEDIYKIFSKSFRIFEVLKVSALLKVFHDATIAELKSQMLSKLKFGPSEHNLTTIGPMINASGLKYMQEVCKDAVAKGAKITLGGNPRPDLGKFYFEPTLIENVTLDMIAFSEETFGPVTAVAKFSDENDVIEKANQGWHGLAAYFYSNDAAECWRVADQIETGMLGINEVAISTVECPFGGTRESGIGREGGEYGMEEYMEVKYVNWNYSI